MGNLTNALADEFATVDVVLGLNAKTSRVDAFALTWIKAEKQLRRLFCFLVFQNPSVSAKNRDEFIEVIAKNTELSIFSLIEAFDALSPMPLRSFVGTDYSNFIGDLKRMRANRNKIIHGQITGRNLTKHELEKDIQKLRQWIETVAETCANSIGYDGMGRNTFSYAKGAATHTVNVYPFQSAMEFEAWLKKLL